MNFNKKPLAALISFTLFAAAVSAQTTIASEAADEVERITVQGALVPTPLSEMAASISVLTEYAIEQRHAQHLEDLLNRASNVNFATGASRGRFVQIRGIGERSQFTDPINPSVGFLVDGISYTGILAGAGTFDVAQIEIFKGPNSARFGAEGLAGMINMITQDASAETSFDAQFGLANYGSYQLGAALGGAISDSVNYRVSMYKNESDGFIDNTYLGRDDTNNIDELTTRLKVNWQATEDLLFKTVLHIIDVDNGYDAFSLDRDRTTLSDEPGFDRQKSTALGVNAIYDGLDWAQLDIHTSLLDADLDYGYDEDWSFVGIAPALEYSSTDRYLRERSNNTLELKLRSKTDETNAWVVGAYYSSEDEDLLREFFDFDLWQDAELSSTVARKNLALFGQYTHHISDTQWLSASLRLASQSFDYKDTNDIISDIDHQDWGAELSYHQRVSDSTMLYVSAVRSYKMGGVNGQALSKIDDIVAPSLRQALLDNAEFDAESLLGLEFGVKGSNENGNLRVNLAMFYQKRKDAQFKNSIVEGQTFIDSFNNAASGTNSGIELSLDYTASDNVLLFANLGYLHTTIKGFTRQGGETIDDRDQAHAPTYQVNVGSNINLTEDLSWLVELDAKDEFYYSFSHDNLSEEIVLLHTSLDYVMGSWKVSLYARNLFDKEYANRGFAFGNDPRDGYEAHVYEQFGEPRRVGISLNYQY